MTLFQLMSLLRDERWHIYFLDICRLQNCSKVTVFLNSSFQVQILALFFQLELQVQAQMKAAQAQTCLC